MEVGCRLHHSITESTALRLYYKVYKLGAVYRERLKIEVKLYYRVLIGSHICRVDWHNNGWPWMAVARIARYLCGSWAFRCGLLSTANPQLATTQRNGVRAIYATLAKATGNSRNSRKYVFRKIPSGIPRNFAPFYIKFCIYYNLEFW